MTDAADHSVASSSSSSSSRSSVDAVAAAAAASSSSSLGVSADLASRWAAQQCEMRKRLIVHDKLEFKWEAEEARKKKKNTDRVAKGDATSAAAAAAVASSSSSSSSSSSLPPLRLIGGVDISFVGDSDSHSLAALVVLSYPSLQLVYQDFERVTISQPYIAGFLAFREVPPLTLLIERLKRTRPELMPQIMLVDGNGLLHHRAFGLACQLGVVADIPTIGVAKNLLLADGLTREWVEQHAHASLHQGGDWFELIGASGAVWGAALRSTTASSNPIFVSIGHRVCLDTAVDIVTRCCKHRIPEPIRLADLNSREGVRKWKKELEDEEEKNKKKKEKDKRNSWSSSFSSLFSPLTLSILVAAAAASILLFRHRSSSSSSS